MATAKELLERYDDKIIACTLNEKEMETKFENSSPGTPGIKPFAAWSKDWVYISKDFHGFIYLTRVPRNPKPFNDENIYYVN